MSSGDIIVLVILVLIIAGSISLFVHNRRSGKGNCGCSGCNACGRFDQNMDGCSHCKREK